MKFNNPSLINFVKLASGKMVDLGELEEHDFDKWLAMYNRALRAHWQRRRASISGSAQQAN